VVLRDHACADDKQRTNNAFSGDGASRHTPGNTAVNGTCDAEHALSEGPGRSLCV